MEHTKINNVFHLIDLRKLGGAQVCVRILNWNSINSKILINKNKILFNPFQIYAIWIKKGKSAIIIAHLFKAFIYLLFTPIPNKNKIYYHHSDLINSSPIKSWLFFKIVSSKSTHIFTTETMRNIYEKKYGYFKNTIILNNPAIKINYNNKKNSKEIIFGFIGRFDHVKNIDKIANLFNKINMRINFYGEGKEIFILKKYSSLNNLIKLYSTIPLRDIYSQIDAVILCSKREVYPMVMIEALLNKIPLLAISSEYGVNSISKKYLFPIFKDIHELENMLLEIKNNRTLLSNYILNDIMHQQFVNDHNPINLNKIINDYIQQ